MATGKILPWAKKFSKAPPHVKAAHQIVSNFWNKQNTPNPYSQADQFLRERQDEQFIKQNGELT